jgi:hypothetical protein
MGRDAFCSAANGVWREPVLRNWPHPLGWGEVWHTSEHLLHPNEVRLLKNCTFIVWLKIIYQSENEKLRKKTDNLLDEVKNFKVANMWLDLRKRGQRSTIEVESSHYLIWLWSYCCTCLYGTWKLCRPVSPFNIMREVPPFVKSYHICSGAWMWELRNNYEECNKITIAVTGIDDGSYASFSFNLDTHTHTSCSPNQLKLVHADQKHQCAGRGQQCRVSTHRICEVASCAV